MVFLPCASVDSVAVNTFLVEVTWLILVREFERVAQLSRQHYHTQRIHAEEVSSFLFRVSPKRAKLPDHLPTTASYFPIILSWAASSPFLTVTLSCTLRPE